MNKPECETTPRPTRRERKAYTGPVLTCYGALREITLGVQCAASFPPCSSAHDPFSG
jgi:hypothetical protein